MSYVMGQLEKYEDHHLQTLMVVKRFMDGIKFYGKISILLRAIYFCLISSLLPTIVQLADPECPVSNNCTCTSTQPLSILCKEIYTQNMTLELDKVREREIHTFKMVEVRGNWTNTLFSRLRIQKLIVYNTVVYFMWNDTLHQIVGVDTLLMEKTYMPMWRNDDILQSIAPTITKLNMIWSGFNIIPEGLFANMILLRELNLEGNKLLTLSKHHFFDLISLESLSLGKNSLTYFSYEYVAYCDNLRDISLRANNMQSLAAETFKGGHLTRIDLRDNPFKCDCTFLPGTEYLRNKSIVEGTVVEGTCGSPNDFIDLKITELPTKSLGCFEHPLPPWVVKPTPFKKVSRPLPLYTFINWRKNVTTQVTPKKKYSTTPPLAPGLQGKERTGINIVTFSDVITTNTVTSTTPLIPATPMDKNIQVITDQSTTKEYVPLIATNSGPLASGPNTSDSTLEVGHSKNLTSIGGPLGKASSPSTPKATAITNTTTKPIDLMGRQKHNDDKHSHSTKGTGAPYFLNISKISNASRIGTRGNKSSVKNSKKIPYGNDGIEIFVQNATLTPRLMHRGTVDDQAALGYTPNGMEEIRATPYIVTNPPKNGPLEMSSFKRAAVIFIYVFDAILVVCILITLSFIVYFWTHPPSA